MSLKASNLLHVSFLIVVWGLELSLDVINELYCYLKVYDAFSSVQCVATHAMHTSLMASCFCVVRRMCCHKWSEEMYWTKSLEFLAPFMEPSFTLGFQVFRTEGGGWAAAASSAHCAVRWSTQHELAGADGFATKVRGVTSGKLWLNDG